MNIFSTFDGMRDDATNVWTSTTSATAPLSIDELAEMARKLPPCPDVLLVHISAKRHLDRLPKSAAPVLPMGGLPVEFWRDLSDLDSLIDSVKARGFKHWAVFGSDGRRLPNREPDLSAEGEGSR